MNERMVSVLTDQDGLFNDEHDKELYLLFLYDSMVEDRIKKANEIAEQVEKLMKEYDRLVEEVDEYQDKIKQHYARVQELEQAEEE